jgi:hypothetical protein
MTLELNLRVDRGPLGPPFRYATLLRWFRPGGGGKVGQMARDPRPGPWPVKTARYLGRPGP